MKTQEIKILLDKYYDGDTSLEEEKLLQRQLSRIDLPAELRVHREIFGYYAFSAEEKLETADFVAKLEDKLKAGRKLSLFQKYGRKFYPLAAAAAILIAAGIFFLTNFNATDTSLEKYTVNEPSKAYTEAKKELMLVSVNLNYGMKDLDKLSALQKGLDGLQKLQKIENLEKK